MTRRFKNSIAVCGVAVCLTAFGGCGGFDPVAQTPEQQAALTTPFIVDLARDARVRGLIPAVVGGDVNSDGRLDQTDIATLQPLVGATVEAADSQLDCASAADLDLDGVISAREVGWLSQIVQRSVDSDSGLAFPMVHVREHCDMSGALLSSPVIAVPDEPFAIRTIAPLTVHASDYLAPLSSASGEQTFQPTSVSIGTDIDIVITHLGKHHLLSVPVANPVLDPVPDASAVAGGGSVPAVCDKGDDPPLLPPREGEPAPGEEGDPPFDPEDPPTIETPGRRQCPQRNAGCSVLLVGFFHSGLETLLAGNATEQANEFQALGCSVHKWNINSYPAAKREPRNRRVCMHPQPRPWEMDECGDCGAGCNLYTPAEFKARRIAWRQARAAARTGLTSAIEGFRADVRGGKKWTLTLVTGHGSREGGDCGVWLDASGWVSLKRSGFHQGNYEARRCRTCENTDIDISCFAGKTPQAVGSANNTTKAKCGTPYSRKCRLNAGFDLDVALGSSDACSMTIFAGWFLTNVDSAAESVISDPSRSLASTLADRSDSWGASYRDTGYGQCQ